MLDKEEVMQHPSYGMISVHRIHTGKPLNFFGSELKQTDYIQIELRNGEQHRQLHQNRYYATQGPDVFRIRMTANQFTELITTLNIGSGTPCTIEISNKSRIESCPETISEKTLIGTEFEYGINSISETIIAFRKELEDVISSKTIPAKRKCELLKNYDSIVCDLTKNLPFILSSFTENVDTIITDAKNEIDSAIHNKIQSIGIEAITNNPKLILGEKNV